MGGSPLAPDAVVQDATELSISFSSRDFHSPSSASGRAV